MFISTRTASWEILWNILLSPLPGYSNIQGWNLKLRKVIKGEKKKQDHSKRVEDNFLIHGTVCVRIFCVNQEGGDARFLKKKKRRKERNDYRINWLNIWSNNRQWYHIMMCRTQPWWKNSEWKERCRIMGSERHHVLQRHLVSFTYTGIPRKLQTAVRIGAGSVLDRWEWKTILKKQKNNN